MKKNKGCFGGSRQDTSVVVQYRTGTDGSVYADIEASIIPGESEASRVQRIRKVMSRHGFQGEQFLVRAL
jgi:hypothetical protein